MCIHVCVSEVIGFSSLEALRVINLITSSSANMEVKQKSRKKSVNGMIFVPTFWQPMMAGKHYIVFFLWKMKAICWTDLYMNYKYVMGCISKIRTLKLKGKG